MTTSKFALGMLLGTALLAPAAAHHCCADNSAKDANLAFERFKKLVGDWTIVNPKEMANKSGVDFTYRLTAGGSAVVETVFAGTDHEMVTVYYVDGDRLVLTHYCHLGNQPHMRASGGGDKDVVNFEFAGGSNIDPAKDTHMHSARFQFGDPEERVECREQAIGLVDRGANCLGLARIARWIGPGWNG